VLTLPSSAAQPARRFSSPLSRALTRERGLDLQSLTGSGPNGRIVKADVLAALKAGAGPHAAAPQRPTRFSDVPHTLGRKLIARRLTESQQQAPHFYARIDCCVDPLLALRASAQPWPDAQGLKPTLNDFVIWAAARALRDVPEVNVSFADTAMRCYQQVHIAVAVAVEQGLVTPVIADADDKTVVQIAREMRALVEQARAGALPAGASAGGTFSVSNLGALGVREFTAVINPPQAAILAVGAAQARAVVAHGQLAVATMMTVTLSADHRAIDGAVAARWLAAFQRRMENPREDDLW